MASHVLSSNYRLGSTTKLWSNNTKKKHRFKVLKLNLFFNSFLYYYLMLLNSQILFSYFYYFNLLSWYIDLFVFRGIGDVFTRKEKKARFNHIWGRQKMLFHKVRRPYSIKLHQFILTYMKGYIQKQRFNNKLLLGKLKTSSASKKKDFIKDWRLLSKKLKTMSFFKRRFFFYKRKQILRKFILTLLRKKAIFSKFYQTFFFRKPITILKTFFVLKNKQSFNATRRSKINILFLQKRLKMILNSWKYKKQKKLIWRAVKTRIFIKKLLKSKKRNKIFLKKLNKTSSLKKLNKTSSLKKLNKTSSLKKLKTISSSKKLNKTFFKKKKIAKHKQDRALISLRLKNKRSLINPLFLKYILPIPIPPVKFSKLFKINLARRSRGFVKRLKLSSKILPIQEIKDWEEKKAKKPAYLKKVKQSFLMKLNNWEGSERLLTRRPLQKIAKQSLFLGKFQYNIYVAKRKHLIFLKKLYKQKLISITKSPFFFSNRRTVFSLKKKYIWRKVRNWRQQNIQILNKQKKDSYYCISFLKKLKRKYCLSKNFKIKVINFKGDNWKYKALVKQRMKWLASKNVKLKKEKYYCLKRRKRFFLYNFQQSFYRKKTFPRRLNLRNKFLKRFLRFTKSKKLPIKLKNQFIKKPKYLHLLKKKTRKADIFYHWFWGFRRFQRIHKMIGNVSKYKEFFFRDFKSARETYCLRYTRPKSSIKRFSNLLDKQIERQKQLLKLFFFFVKTKKSLDKQNLFFRSRLREYNFFLKKLYFSIKQKQFWLVVYRASKVFLKHKKTILEINKTNNILPARKVIFTFSKLFNFKANVCRSFGLSFIKLSLKKNYLKINFFLAFKKKKFFLLKYLNLIYSLKLSSLFLTTIHCFFISCILLFSKNERRFKDIVFDKLERYSNFRRLPTYLIQRFGFIFLLSLKFKQFFLFLEYIKFLFLKYSRKQFIIMTFYKLFLRSNFFNYLANVVGFQFSLKGKMNRRPRARRILFFKKNRPAFQRLNLKIHYYAKQFTNYFGTFTVKFWLYYY